MADASPRPRARHDYLVGLALLLLVVLLWTGSNFLTNSLLTSGWDKPFAVTYANTSSFALYMVPFACALRRKASRGRGRSRRSDAGVVPSWATKLGFSLPLQRRDERRDEEERLIAGGRGLRATSPDIPRRPSSIDGRRPLTAITPLVAAPHAAQLAPLTVRETAILAAQFTLVWVLANYCLNASLALTSVASSTTLSSASGFFTLALGSLTGVERFSPAKLVAVCVSFVGVALVTHADAVGARAINASLGDACALASAFFYALYVTLLKLRIQSEDRVSMPLFFGFVGLFNIFTLWPVALILSATGVEPLELPPDSATWAGVAVNMAITFVSDFAYLLSMLKTAPLVATVGLSLTIPLAVVIDVIRGTHSGGWRADLGSAAVLLSFVAIGWDDSRVDDVQAQ